VQTATADQIASRLGTLAIEEPRLVVSGNFATPHELLEVAVSALERCRLFVLNPQERWPLRDGVVTETPFIGPGARGHESVDYLPMRLSLVPRLFRSIRRPDIVLIHTSAPRGGRVSLGIEVNIIPAAIEAVCRGGGLVIAQVNPQMPYLAGDAEIELDLVDLALEVDRPLPSPSARPPDDVATAIGSLVADLAEDGCTVQSGIGQIPDAALGEMRALRGLGIWSEMVSDGVMELEHAGALDDARLLTSTFLFGSEELYAWARDHPRLFMLRTETVNDPARIAAQPAMVSINTALQVDLFAQANASFVRGSIYSGFGGQPDFVTGALHSPGGHAVIALRSWHEKTNSSNVVPILDVPVSSFQHSAFVTEHGRAVTFGHSQREQAAALIEHAADPRARADLLEAAGSLGLLSER
jgi:acyl-CoA hydrolase